MSRKKIFIVDDNSMFAQMLNDHLSKHPDYDVSVFATGEDCLANLYLNPDLILLDYYLNDVSREAANGLEILQGIKKEKSPVHVIMMSGQTHYGVAAQTISKGAEQYIIKNSEAFDNIDRILEDIFR
jgi:DNA-binding NarL/FixJ family response regulator